MWVQVPPSVPFKVNMKNQNRRTKHEVIIVFIVIILAICVGPGCTWTVYRPPMELKYPQQTPVSKSEYRYYVIDEHSTIPDAFFKSKKEALMYKNYFKANHNYVVVQLQ